MKTISLCMIVKNEERYINNCLKSICDIVDEIIIIDTGSSDKTKEICRKYTDKIYDFEWINDFSAARNYSFSKATCDYVFWLDADDVLLEDDRIKFKQLKENLSLIDNDYISMVYNYSFGINGLPTLTFKRNRLVKRETNPTWIGFVHEVMDLDITSAFPSDIVVTHTKNHSSNDRNLKIFENQKNNNNEFTLRDTLYYAKELYYNNRYEDAIIEFKKFLSVENPYYYEDHIDALINMYECYTQLHEKSNTDIERNLLRNERRNILLKTFDITMPRAEALYRLADTYIEEEKYKEAIFYLESIFNFPYPENCPGFLNKEMWTILPNLQLCYCYYCMGDIRKALEYHKKCIKLAPENESVQFNEKFFSQIN